ncbi:MAG: Sjogren's syndrome/scleroderma autoantigen 1 family protein [Halobacteriota archaeon]
MEDKKISDISKLLIRGAKMLSYHCPECNVPLFQEGERIFCPSCQKEAIIGQKGEREVADASETDVVTSEGVVGNEVDKPSQEQGPEKKVIRGSSRIYEEMDMSTAEISLKNSLLKLSGELENARDVKEIKEIIEVMEKITSLAERIKRL